MPGPGRMFFKKTTEDSDVEKSEEVNEVVDSVVEEKINQINFNVRKT